MERFLKRKKNLTNEKPEFADNNVRIHSLIRDTDLIECYMVGDSGILLLICLTFYYNANSCRRFNHWTVCELSNIYHTAIEIISQKFFS